MSLDLTKKVKFGFLWNFLEQFMKKGVTALVTLILAYFLVPEDFGLLAMMAIFIALGLAIMDGGIKDAVIRQESIDEQGLSTAFWINLFLASFTYLILFVSAPFVADFYAEERITELLRLISLLVIFNAFHSVQEAIFAREMDFKSPVVATVPASVIAGLTAIGLAYFDYGVYALIIQMLLFSIIRGYSLWKLSKWRPKCVFLVPAAKELIDFGYKLLISLLIVILSKNIFSLVIAKFFGLSIAGLYYFANKIVEMVSLQLIFTVQNVVYPALSKVQNDEVKLRDAYSRVIKLTTFFVFPVFCLGAVLAEPLFKVVFPEEWWQAAVIFQILCLTLVLTPVHVLNMNVLKVKGRSDLYLRVEILKLVVTVVTTLVLIPYGVEAILWGNVGISVLMLFITTYFSWKMIAYPMQQQFRDFAPSMILIASVSVLTLFLMTLWDFAHFLPLLALSVFSVLLYLGVAHLLRFEASTIFWKLILKR